MYDPITWEHLVRQGEWDFPEEWHDSKTDVEAWMPTVAEICRRHSIDATSLMPVPEGTHLAYIAGDAVVKIYARRSPVWYEREVESLRVLTDRPAAATPRLLADGDIVDEDGEHCYIIMSRVPGEPYRRHRDSMTLEEQLAIARQLAPMVRAINETPLDHLPTLGTDRATWARRMRERTRYAHDYLDDSLQPHLLEQLPDYLATRIDAITEEFEPVLLHTDVISGNIMVARRDGGWQVSGLIDLGDVEIGPIEYEWVSIAHKTFLSSHRHMREFLEAYGVALPFSPQQREQLKLYTLLHRFSPVFATMEEQKEFATIDEYLESMW